MAQHIERGRDLALLPRRVTAVGTGRGGHPPRHHAGKVTGAPLYVVHVSAKQAMEQIRHCPRRRGQRVRRDLPQYLYLSLEEQLGRPGSKAPNGCLDRRCAPARTPSGRAVALHPRRRRRDSVHRPLPFCFKGQRRWASTTSPRPDGMAGVEHRMDLMYQGVVNGESSWCGSTSCATTPARMFGLYPSQGHHLSRGRCRHGDLRPSAHTSIGLGKTHHFKLDHSTWEGFEIDGGVRTVLSRGSVIVDRGQYLGHKGPRGPSSSEHCRRT